MHRWFWITLPGVVGSDCTLLSNVEISLIWRSAVAPSVAMGRMRRSAECRLVTSSVVLTDFSLGTTYFLCPGHLLRNPPVAFLHDVHVMGAHATSEHPPTSVATSEPLVVDVWDKIAAHFLFVGAC